MGKSGWAILAAWSLLIGAAMAQTPSLLYANFQDHEVLQRNKPITVWGTTTPGATVTVSLAGETTSAAADATGQWQAVLAPLAAGGPYELKATSSSGASETNSDVMIGDVYLCSGQSNMEFPTKYSSGYTSDLDTATNTQIRLFHVERFESPTPRETYGAPANWAVVSPESVREFSAACYFFGRDLQPKIGVPLGLIEDAWGGSAIQAWISNEKLAALGGYDKVLDIVKLYATSPKDADLAYRALVYRWFDANDPTMRTSMPWYAPSLDDADWNANVPIGTWRSWNVPKLETFNGLTWLRKTVNLTAEEAQGEAALSLGTIDTFDLTFVNGVEVGAGEGYDAPRHYTVPAGTLHEGKNVIAMGIVAGAGLLDPADKLTLTFANGAAMALSGPWKWKTSVALDKTKPLAHQPWLNQFGVSTLYNGMILPLGPIAIRGVVWYQGETDAGQPFEYRRLLQAMIENWRGKFGADIPFLVVQLPNFGDYAPLPGHSNWAQLRESQRLVSGSMQDVGLAVTIDLGQRDNIHPTDKQDVGTRLALLAEKMIYKQDVVANGPAPVSAIRKGKTVAIRFDHAEGGLVVEAYDRPVAFQLCDKPDHCRFVDAVARKNAVLLDARKMPHATFVRYCWADSPLCNIYNSAGLPAVPFETPIVSATRARK